jgi:hypothetical protein
MIRLKPSPVFAWRAVAVVVATLAVFAFSAGASAHPHPPAPHPHPPGMPVSAVHAATPAMLRSAGLLPARLAASGSLSSNWFNWNNYAYPSQCIRDPSGGGAGTTVLNSGCSTSNAEDWEWATSYYCTSGKVTSDCPGGPISTYFLNGALITWRNLALGYSNGCFHTNDSTSWTAVMVPSCGDASTTYAVVLNSAGTAYAFVSVKADTEYGCLYYLDNNGVSNSALFADLGQNARCAATNVYDSQLWKYTSS